MDNVTLARTRPTAPCTRHDRAADLVIEALALSEAELLQRVADLEADVAVYRELAQAGIHELHELTLSHERLRDQHQRLLDEYRHLRVQIMSAAVAA